MSVFKFILYLITNRTRIISLSLATWRLIKINLLFSSVKEREQILATLSHTTVAELRPRDASVWIQWLLIDEMILISNGTRVFLDLQQNVITTSVNISHSLEWVERDVNVKTDWIFGERNNNNSRYFCSAHKSLCVTHAVSSRLSSIKVCCNGDSLRAGKSSRQVDYRVSDRQ
jgi:hypothetical protein